MKLLTDLPTFSPEFTAESPTQMSMSLSHTLPVQVALRIRPLTSNERQRVDQEYIRISQNPKTNQPTVTIVDNNATTFPTGTVTLQTAMNQAILSNYLPKTFTFDHVFDSLASQRMVYGEVIVPLVNNFIKGFNTTALAYGQTGSGKTYTMGLETTILKDETNVLNHGIIPRAAQAIFTELEIRKERIPSLEYAIKLTFLELYNEEFIDLLGSSSTTSVSNKRHSTEPTPTIRIRDDGTGNVVVLGASEHVVHNADEIMEFIRKGCQNRFVASNNINELSSRSHAILTLTLIQNWESDSQNAAQPYISKTSKFNFVDLAGSERLKKSKSKGERAKEGIFINSELHVLGKCISALSSSNVNSNYVPYRDSKLTRLLRDSLGGNSRTVMIACVSPAPADLFETRNTLRYSSRARTITNVSKMNVETDVTKINKLREELSLIKAQLKSVRDDAETTQEKAESLSRRNHSLELKLSSTSEAYSKLKDQYESLQRELDRLLKEKEDLLFSAQIAANSPISKTKEPDSFNNITSPTYQEQSELIREYEEKLTHTCNLYETKLKELSKTYEGKINVILHDYAAAETLAEQMARQVDKLTLQVQSLDSQLTSYRKRVAEMETELNAAHSNILQKDEHMEQMSSKITSLDNELRKSADLINELTKNNSELIAYSSSVKSVESNKVKELELQVATKSQAIEQFTTMERQLRATLDEIRTMNKTEVSRLQTELNAKQDVIREMMNMEAELRTYIKDMEQSSHSRIQSLETQIEKLSISESVSNASKQRATENQEKVITEAVSKITLLEQIKVTQEQTIGELDTEMNNLNDALIGQLKDNFELIVEVNHFKEANKSQSAMIDFLKQRVAALEGVNVDFVDTKRNSRTKSFIKTIAKSDSIGTLLAEAIRGDDNGDDDYSVQDLDDVVSCYSDSEIHDKKRRKLLLVQATNSSSTTFTR